MPVTAASAKKLHGFTAVTEPHHYSRDFKPEFCVKNIPFYFIVKYQGKSCLSSSFNSICQPSDM